MLYPSSLVTMNGTGIERTSSTQAEIFYYDARPLYKKQAPMLPFERWTYVHTARMLPLERTKKAVALWYCWIWEQQ